MNNNPLNPTPKDKFLKNKFLNLKTIFPILTLIAGVLLIFKAHSSFSFLFLMGSLLGSMIVRVPTKQLTFLFVFTLLVALPMAGFKNSFLLELATQAGIYAALALGLNIVVGMAGLLDLGFSAFFAIGAYTWAIVGSTQGAEFLPGIYPLSGGYFYLFMIVAVFTAALLGVIVGLPALRLRGDYLAIVTLGLGEVVRVLANNLDHPINITNGPKGITPIQRPPVEFLSNILQFLGLKSDNAMTYSLFFYLLVLLLIVIIIVFNLRLGKSRFGRAWNAIRDNELAARAMGVNLLKTKLLAFATGAAFSGVMGAVYAAKQTFVSPESFTLLQSITILSMVILGGMGNVAGAVLGACIVTVLNIDVLKSMSEFLGQLRQSGQTFDFWFFSLNPANIPEQLEPAKYERMVFGIILILMMIFRPEGLLPPKRKEEKPNASGT